jgi:hypothetical protein
MLYLNLNSVLLRHWKWSLFDQINIHSFQTPQNLATDPLAFCLFRYLTLAFLPSVEFQRKGNHLLLAAAALDSSTNASLNVAVP